MPNFLNYLVPFTPRPKQSKQPTTPDNTKRKVSPLLSNNKRKGRRRGRKKRQLKKRAPFFEFVLSKTGDRFRATWNSSVGPFCATYSFLLLLLLLLFFPAHRFLRLFSNVSTTSRLGGWFYREQVHRVACLASGVLRATTMR